MFWKKKTKKGPPLPVDAAGKTTLTVTGVPYTGHKQVKVVSEGGTIEAVVADHVWYDKTITLHSASPEDGTWKSVTFGLDQKQAQTIAAALLGLTDAQVTAAG